MQRGVTATSPTAMAAASGVAVSTTSPVAIAPLFTGSYYLLSVLITLTYLVVLYTHA